MGMSRGSCELAITCFLLTASDDGGAVVFNEIVLETSQSSIKEAALAMQAFLCHDPIQFCDVPGGGGTPKLNRKYLFCCMFVVDPSNSSISNGAACVFFTLLQLVIQLFGKQRMHLLIAEIL